MCEELIYQSGWDQGIKIYVTEEMAQCVRGLLCKHEPLSSNPQCPEKPETQFCGSGARKIAGLPGCQLGSKLTERPRKNRTPDTL